MSTRSAVGVRIVDGTVRARYVHWDGHHVGDTVRALIARDGKRCVVQTIIVNNYGWSSLELSPDPELPSGYDDGRFKVVPGYGVAYTEKDGQSSPEDWVDGLGDWGIEFFHVIEVDGSVTTTS